MSERRVRFGRKQINIIHVRPFFAKATKSILLRVIVLGKSCEARRREAGWRRERNCKPTFSRRISRDFEKLPAVEIQF